MKSIIAVRAFAALGLGLTLAAATRADQIVLRGGGEIRGVVVPDASRPEHILIQTDTATSPIVFRAEQIERIIRRPGPLTDYLAKRDAVESTADAHYALGEWCEQFKLTGPAEIHYRKAIELDKSHAAAHKKLGHVLWQGKWLSHDELREAQGLVRHKGRWITREEKEQVDARTTRNGEERTWARRLTVLRSALLTGTGEELRRAEAELLAIQNPAAIAPLLAVLGSGDGAMRVLMAHVLGGLPGPEATSALVHRILDEPDLAVRQATLNELARRQDPNGVAELLQALDQKSAQTVGRAAWALANLGETAAIPKLIPKLASVERRLVFAPTTSGPIAPGGYNVSAASADPSQPGGGTSVGVITGVSVAPGAVAYGGAAVPFGSGYPVVSTGIGASPRPRLRPRYRVVTVVNRNVEVLDALEKLTGQRLGYDVAAWRRWARASFQSAPEQPGRSVPQP